MCKECLEKAKLVVEIVAICAAIYYGSVLTSHFQERELNLENLKLAVGVLSEAPTKDQEPLRKWAIEAFSKFADPQPTPEVLDMLRNKPAEGFLNTGFLTTGFMTDAQIKERLENDGGYLKHLDGIEKMKYIQEHGSLNK